MPLQLTWSAATDLPVEAGWLRPDSLMSLSTAEVARLHLAVGNATAEVGELFKVEGQGADGCLVVVGDLRRLARLGSGMASGQLTIEGEAGDHLGAAMNGGTITVNGSAGDWTGAELRGGLIRIKGSVGHFLGAAYPGSRRGMRSGTILVDGSAGNDAGLSMRRGLIAIGGSAGDCLGRSLIAGSLFAFGPIGAYAGAGMKRGTLALFGNKPPDLLPSFPFAGGFRPVFLALYLRQLCAWSFPVPTSAFAGSFDRYNGDLVEGGQGEILVWKP
ncbi:MAG TPA: formylmethanofuran dehydrogenase subunit C [Isosphaeraceae bacterium]|jgi:formylmethanofuran dehydrogenase subunit C|nr:formylmethanofuran dehydrogenase subunit C [Isosphaeraceae bacterium]